MVLLSGGFKAWVEVDAQVSNEYNIVHTSDGEINETSCLIEAKECKRFRIRFCGLSTFPESQTVLHFHIDGKWVASRAFCRYNLEKQSGSIDGYSEQIGGSRPTIRTFVFGKAQTTDKGSVDDLPQHLKNEGCTIRVDIQVFPRFGPLQHNAEPEEHCVNKGENAIHMDSKPATLGILTSHGNVLKRKTTLRHCACEVKGEAYSHQRIIFTYISKNWLAPHIRANEIRAGRLARTELSMEKDGAQEISRIRFVSGAKSAQLSSKGNEETRKDQNDNADMTMEHRSNLEPLESTMVTSVNSVTDEV